MPYYHRASEWATGSNAIATNTPCNQLASLEEEFRLASAGLETRAMTKGTHNGAELTSTVHQHAAHIRERRRTSAATTTVCSFQTTEGKHRSDRYPLKTAIGNHVKVYYQQALDSLTKNLGMPREQQYLQMVAWM